MDLTIIIGLISSILTIGEVGNSLFSYVKHNRKFLYKYKIKKQQFY